MSFDVFLSCWREQSEVSFGRNEFDCLFPDKVQIGARTGKLQLIRATFADGEGDVYISAGDECSGFMANHVGSALFYDAMVELASRTRSIIYWAGKPPCLAMTHMDVLKELPPDMVNSIGPGHLIKNGADLRHCFNADFEFFESYRSAVVARRD